jgi:ABC-type histidine transport system ATPase subunit
MTQGEGVVITSSSDSGKFTFLQPIVWLVKSSHMVIYGVLPRSHGEKVGLYSSTTTFPTPQSGGLLKVNKLARAEALQRAEKL